MAPTSTTVNPGEAFGFIGPNGAGKTTTIKILMGLHGDVGDGEIFGTSVTDARARQRVGFSRRALLTST